MAGQTATVTIAALPGPGNSSGSPKVGGQPMLVKTTAVDSTGAPTEARVLLSSSNRGVAVVTTAEQKGNAPAGVVGIGAGSATITAVAEDNSGASATLAVAPS